MTGSPLTHMVLFGGSTEAFCGAKTDRYTRARCEAQHVTCKTCLEKAAKFHIKALSSIRVVLSGRAQHNALAAMITDERVRALRDSLPAGKDRELLTAGLVPGDCPICGSEGDDACRSGKRGAPEMDRPHWQRVHLGRARKEARVRAIEILEAGRD